MTTETTKETTKEWYIVEAKPYGNPDTDFYSCTYEIPTYEEADDFVSKMGTVWQTTVFRIIKHEKLKRETIMMVINPITIPE